MPQLPSGRHIAISPIPLSNLLTDARSPGSIHRILALKTNKDIEPYINVIYLVPEAEAGEPNSDAPFRRDSISRANGLVQVPSGYRLSEWDKLTAGWSPEDKTAMQVFLNERATQLFQDCLEQVQRTQDALRADKEFMSRVLVGWFDAGCHPAQEAGWDESDVGLPEWDDYDVLAALGQIRTILSQSSELTYMPEIWARLDAFWRICVQELPALVDWPTVDKPVRDCASKARQANWLDSLDDGKRHWLHNQAIAECVELWSVLGDGFRATFTQAYGIVELVVVSSEANKYFPGTETAKADHGA